MNQSIKPARILIVDDHPNTAAMLARVLSRFDTPVEVLTAHSGEEALQLVGDTYVDILITDFMMSGINGLELVEKIGKEQPPTHTILITAYDSPGLAITAKQLKIQDYLVKPVQPDKIRDIVAKVLREIRPPESIEAGPQFRSAKILIADDYPDNIRLLSTRLKNEGYTFVTAADGDETLKQLRAESPDLLLLDVNMPVKDGFQVLEEMRSDPNIAHIPVIVITAARITSKDVREGLSLGADDYVTKPVDWGELAARIRTKLRVKRAEDELRERNQGLVALPELSLDLGERLDIEALTHSVLSRAVKALDANNGFLVVFHPDGNATLQFHKMIDFSPWTWEQVQTKIVQEGLTSQVVSSRQHYIVEDTTTDTHWLQLPNDASLSAIATPLLGRYDVLGALVLTRDSSAHFREDHLKLLQAIASQAAMAIENAQLYVVERKRVNELVALSQITRSVSSIARSRELFDRLPSLVHQVFGYPIVALWAVGETGLSVISLADPANLFEKSLFELAPQKVLQSGKPAQLSGPINNDANIDTKTGPVFSHASVAVPIHENKTLKAILSIHSQRSNAFSENDRVMLETLVAQVGTVLERIVLFESVEKEQNRLSAVLSGAADAILVIDPLGILQLTNPAAQRLFTDVEARVGQAIPSGKGYDDLLALLDKYRQSPSEKPAEITWPDGRTFSVMITAIEEAGQVIVLHDVSHFKSLDQLKNQFLATASHDLKNPIFAVLGYSDFLKQAGPLTPMQQDFIARIQNAANRMQDLVVNLLDIARMEMESSIKKEKVHINELLEQIVLDHNPQAQSKKHIIDLELPATPIYLWCDRTRVIQAVSNLISNAIKYTPPEGHIVVSAEQDEAFLWIRVKDNGFGIPKESIPQLFAKFFRVQTEQTQDIEGNGLGLAIVKSIVEQHEGRVEVSSVVGEGSLFSIGLPV